MKAVPLTGSRGWRAPDVVLSKRASLAAGALVTVALWAAVIGLTLVIWWRQ